MIRAMLTAGATALSVVALLVGPPTVEADDAPWTLPVRPPVCTEDEAMSGDVDECLLYVNRDPAEEGWGVPPVPGVGEGWVWNGHTYSGSPALAGWESELIASNTESLAGFGPDYFETHVTAQVLFEGFLADITERGYDIRHASAYSFRCTAGSGGWSCPGGNVGGLSLHAWGLAIDMNSDRNPIRSYSGENGQTACATPIETDMPRWVIQTAEKWGLYWGGYGWSRGCIDTSTERTSVFRDPPHFEFRGTPEMARAIAAHNLGDAFAGICFPIVDDEGIDQERCNSNGRPEAGWRIPVTVEPPDGSTAAMVNLAVTEASSQGHISLEDCAPRSGPRDTAALTFAAGQTVAAMAVVPLDELNRFCVYSNASVHRVIDVVAFLAGPDVPPPDDGTDPPPADDGGDPPADDGTDPTATETGADQAPLELLWFEPVAPTRLVDTRDGIGRVSGGSEHRVSAEAGEVRLANLATTGSIDRGYLQAGGCGELGPERDFSSLNYAADTTRSNLAFIVGNDGGTCVFALSETHLIVDELGRFGTEPGLGWDLSTTGRLLDTRECSDVWCDDAPAGGNILRVPIDTEAAAMVVAITATQSTDRGYIWAGPCSALDGRSVPPTSNLNHAAGETTTNLAIVNIEAGEFCVFNRAPGHYVIDLQALLAEAGGLGVAPIEPTRVHDSRDPVVPAADESEVAEDDDPPADDPAG